MKKKLSFIIFYILISFIFLNQKAFSDSYSSSASILLYHRFGEDKFPSTSISIEQLEKHIRILTQSDYNVMRLENIASAIKRGESLPDKTVAITIDDAFKSIYTVAWPKLRDANLPFTVFVSTDTIDKKYSSMMNWKQIKELHDSGVTIGNHLSTHESMVNLDSKIWKEKIDYAQKRLTEILGEKPLLFAYPYGEANNEMKTFLRERGYTAAFGQHSGVASEWLDPFFLPRFSFNEKYGGIERLELAINALPLPVKDIIPRKIIITNNPPYLGFTIIDESLKLDRLQCFASRQSKPSEIDILPGNRVEVRFQEKFQKGRNRVNCTLPSKNNRWHWLGFQLIAKNTP